MRTLFSLLGEDNFSKALKSYFKKYQWKNAALKDLLAEMQTVIDEDPTLNLNLKEWEKDWLTTSGLNYCEPKFTPGESAIDITQGGVRPEFKTLR